MYRSQTAEGENGLVVPGATAEEEQPPKPESKLKSLFRGRRRTGRQSRGRRATEAAKEQPQKETSPTAPGTEGATEEATATGARDRSRSAALSSHPITGEELNEMQRRRSSVTSNEGPRRPSAAEENGPSSAKGNGNGENRRSSWFRNSLMRPFSRNSESKTNGNGVAAVEEGVSRRGSAVEPSTNGRRTSTTAGREELRDSAAEQGLPVPPSIGKEASNSTARESRFSEDL